MKHALLVLAGLAVSSPALALQTPAPVKEDPRVRLIPYDPNQVVSLSAAVGSTLTVQFPDGEAIQQAALSDTASLQRAMAGNVLWLKPVKEMVSQPISVRTVTEDGKGRVYTFQWQTSATGTFYLVRFTDPAAAAAKAAAAWRQRQAQAESQRVAAALKNPPPAPLNYNYAAQGDRVIEGRW